MKIKWPWVLRERLEQAQLEHKNDMSFYMRVAEKDSAEIRRLEEDRNRLYRELNEGRIRYSNLLASLPCLELMKRNEWR